MSSYLTQSWVGLSNTMIEQNVTAFLTGHTHRDLIGPVAALKDAYTGDYTRAGLQSGAEVSNATPGYLTPISEPQLLITRSAGKLGGPTFELPDFLDLPQYSGYRLISIAENRASNYTYDWDGDGVRDPQLSVPNGGLQTSIALDPQIGVDPAAGATWTLNNSLNEALPAARAVFRVPAAPAGMTWGLSAPALTQGAYIRAIVTDGETCWIDARIPSAPRSLVDLRIVPVAGGI
jgi:hypothetical protein